MFVCNYTFLPHFIFTFVSLCTLCLVLKHVVSLHLITITSSVNAFIKSLWPQRFHVNYFIYINFLMRCTHLFKYNSNFKLVSLSIHNMFYWFPLFIYCTIIHRHRHRSITHTYTRARVYKLRIL